MKTREVIHHYLGAAHCEYVYNSMVPGFMFRKTVRGVVTLATVRGYQFREIKRLRLILRPLSDMTTQEYHEYVRLELNATTAAKEAHEIQSRVFSPRTVIYMISRGFDLFGLIDSGDAIDATTLEENPYR